MPKIVLIGLAGLLASGLVLSLTENANDTDFEIIAQPDRRLPVEGAARMQGPFMGGLDLELVFEIGALDGYHAFGEIIDIAASSDSLIAVADRFGCVVRVFAFPSGEAVSELGGCGDGPGEFRQVVSVSFKSDTLLVSDFGRARVMRMNARTGTELRAEPPPFAQTEAPVVVLDASPDAILYSPSWLQTTRQELLAVQTDIGSMRHGLADTEISLTNRTPSMTRRAEACQLKRGGRVVAANPWALQAVVLDNELRPLFNHVDDSPWVGPREEGGPGRWTPGFVRPRVGCADSLAIVRYRTNERVDEHEWRVGLGLLLVISSSGEILQREVVADTMWPHPAAMAPAAGMGDVVFFFQNTWGPYPSVRGYRIRTQGEDR